MTVVTMTTSDRLEADLAEFKAATAGLFIHRKTQLGPAQIALLNTAALFDFEAAKDRDEKWLRDRRRQHQQQRA